MLFRRLVIPAAVALATAVGLPAPALAAPAECSLVLPAKLVVDSRTEQVPHRLSSNCSANGADAASWRVMQTAGGASWWTSVSPASPSGTRSHPDTWPTGTYRGCPAGG